MIAAVVPRHEPWADEAQACLIARASDLSSLIFRVLPYEGHPPLWYLLLMLPARALPFQAINLISGALAVAATYLIVRHSPFPAVVKVLLPFTFFLSFQYGVVARNYSLLPVLLFLVAMTFRLKLDRPFIFAFLVFALASVSAYSYVAAGLIMLGSRFELLRNRKSLSRAQIRNSVAALGGFAVAMAGVALVMRPPADRSFALTSGWDPSRIPTVARDLLTSATAGPGLITVLALLIGLFLFWNARTLWLYLLPTGSVIGVAALLYGAPWHHGIVFLLWIFAVWISLDRLNSAPGRTDSARIRTAAVASVAAVCLFQIGWFVGAARSDLDKPYSGSEALAAFIKERSLDDSVIHGVGFPSIAVNGYFGRNILDNYHGGTPQPAYWKWSVKNGMADKPEDIQAAMPDFVILPVKGPGGEKAVELFPGYFQLAVFEGQLYWKTWALEPDVYILLQRIDTAPRLPLDEIDSAVTG